MPSERIKGILIGATVSVALLLGGLGVYRYVSPTTTTEFDGGSGDEYYNEPEVSQTPAVIPNGQSVEEQKRQNLIDENLRLQNEAMKRQQIMDNRKAIQDKAEHDREIFRRGHSR